MQINRRSFLRTVFGSAETCLNVATVGMIVASYVGCAVWWGW